MKMTCIYPVSTHTNFATVAGNGVPVDLPEPVQAVDEVASAVVKGIDECAESVYPCKIYPASKAIFTASSKIRKIYLEGEAKKFRKQIESRK